MSNMLPEAVINFCIIITLGLEPVSSPLLSLPPFVLHVIQEGEMQL